MNTWCGTNFCRLLYTASASVTEEKTRRNVSPNDLQLLVLQWAEGRERGKWEMTRDLFFILCGFNFTFYTKLYITLIIFKIFSLNSRPLRHFFFFFFFFFFFKKIFFKNFFFTKKKKKKKKTLINWRCWKMVFFNCSIAVLKNQAESQNSVLCTSKSTVIWE